MTKETKQPQRGKLQSTNETHLKQMQKIHSGHKEAQNDHKNTQ